MTNLLFWVYGNFSKKKFTFCLDTKSNKKIKAKQLAAMVFETLLVLPFSTPKF